MTPLSGHPARRPWACLLLLPFLAACDSVTAPETPAPPVDALDGASVSASAIASNEDVTTEIGLTRAECV